MATTIAFDLFSTLVPGLDSPWLRPHEWEESVSAALDVRTPGFAALFSASGPAREVGKLDFREALENAARSLGAAPSPDQVEAGWRVCVDSVAQALLAPRPGVLESLEYLRHRGHRLVLCTNASADAASALRNSQLPIYFDDMVISCEVGVVKPSLGIYSRVSASGYFVGDGGSDELDGAERAGLQAIQVPAYRGPSAPMNFSPLWRSPQAATLEELLALLP